MKVKKYASAETGKYSMIFFQIGLILVLGTTYVGMEWQFSNSEDSFMYDVGDFDEDLEIIPITNINTPPPPPPPPPPAPEILLIVEDETDTKEDIIQSTESNQDSKLQIVIPISAIVEAEKEEEIENVPFFVVEQIPIYPGCEKIKDKEEQKNCMNEKIHGLFGKEFNTGIGEQMELKGKYRIFVVFTINNTGEIVGIKTRGPNPRLEAEAERVAKLLPKMTPGKQRGKSVSVSYSLPIVFEMRQRE